MEPSKGAAESFMSIFSKVNDCGNAVVTSCYTGVFAMEDELLVYAFAILGGALGALLSFLIAKNAKDITAMAVGNEDVLDAGL